MAFYSDTLHKLLALQNTHSYIPPKSEDTDFLEKNNIPACKELKKTHNCFKLAKNSSELCEKKSVTEQPMTAYHQKRENFITWVID